MADEAREARQEGGTGVMLTAEDLHTAADVVYAMGDNEARTGEHGLPFDQLGKFVEGSRFIAEWRGRDAMELDPLAVALGVSIGVVAAVRNLKRGDG